MPEDTDDTINLKQLQHMAGVVSTLRDITSDPLRRAMEERLQRLMIENIVTPCSKPDQELKSQSYKSKDIPIYEKLSPGDVYIIRIIGEELEIIENYEGDIIYKRVKLSIDKL